MSVKFRNPKTEEVFEVTDCCNDMFCEHIYCCDCPILTSRGVSKCSNWVNEHPHEAAKLIGYEVVEDKQMPKINISKFTDNCNITVQCKTEEEAEMFCEELHKLGYAWCDGDSLYTNTNWDSLEDLTCYFHDEENAISTGTPNDVEENEILIQFADLLEESKPRICEVLGLDVGEKFTIENGDNVYYVNKQGYVATDVNLMNGILLCKIINYPEKIKPVIKLCDNEKELIKIIKTLYPKAHFIHKEAYGDNIFEYSICSSNKELLAILYDLEFPSLPMDKEFDITKF